MSTTATEPRKKGAESSSSPTQTMNEVLHETLRGYEKALKTGIELQEQSIGFWSDMLTKIGSPEHLQPKWRGVSPEIFPNLSKELEHSLEVYNQVNTQAVTLFQKSTGLLQAHSVPEAQRCLQDYMEALMGSARVNLHLALNTTSRMMSFWNESAQRACRFSA